MNTQDEGKNNRLRAGLLLLALGVIAGGVYWVNDNYDFRVVRRIATPTMQADVQVASATQGQLIDGQAGGSQSERPAPIVIRLSCVDAEAAMRRVKAPRSLRDQLSGSDKSAPKPIPGKRCRPVAGNLPSSGGETVAAIRKDGPKLAGRK